MDWSSVSRVGAVGGGVFGPIFHSWYLWLERNFTGTAGSVVLRKMALDQFLIGPPCLALFFAIHSFWEGKGVAEELRKKFAVTFAMDCAFWIPVQAFNFLYLPPTYRVLYLGVMSFVWVNIVCIMKNIESYQLVNGQE